MPARLAILTLTLLLAHPAAALDCRTWNRLSPDEKTARIEGKIEGHLSSNESKMWTSESRPAIRRCLQEFLPRIIDDYDDACGQGKSTRPKAKDLDDLFDTYFLSCIG